MTYQGALSELNTIAHNDDIPIYYKPALKEIIYVFENDAVPVADAIDRQAVLKLFATHDGKYLYEAIRDMPSVTVVS